MAARLLMLEPGRRGVPRIVLLLAAGLSTPIGLASNRIEVDLTYESPAKDPIIRPRLAFPVDFCGITRSSREKSHCEATITAHFDDDGQLSASNVALKSENLACRQLLEPWVLKWRLRPNAPDWSHHVQMPITLCGRPEASKKPIELPEPPRPNAVAGVLGRLFKSVAQTYAPVFGSDCESADDD